MGSESEQLLKNEDVNEDTNENVKVSGINNNSSESRDVGLNLSELASDSAKQMGIADIKVKGAVGLGWLQQSDGVMGLVINYGMNVVWNVAASWIELQIDEWRDKLESWLLEQLNHTLISQGQPPITIADKLTTSSTNSSAALTSETEGADIKRSTEKNINAVNWIRIESLIKEISATGSLAKRLEATIQLVDLGKKLESDLQASFYGVLIPEQYKDKSASHKRWINEFRNYLQAALHLARAYEKSQAATSWEKMLAVGIDDVVASMQVLKNSFSGDWIKANATRAMQYVKGSLAENSSLVGQIPAQWDWDEIIYLTEYSGTLIKYYNDIQELPAEKNPLDFVSKALSHNTHILPEPLAGWLQAISTAFDSFRVKLEVFDNLGSEVKKAYENFAGDIDEMKAEISPWVKITRLHAIIANHYKFFNEYLAPLSYELTGLDVSNNYDWDVTKETFALMEVQNSLYQFDGVWDFLLNDERHRELQKKTKDTIFTKGLVENFSDLRHKMPRQTLGAGELEILEGYLRYHKEGSKKAAFKLAKVIIKRSIIEVYNYDNTIVIKLGRFLRNKISLWHYGEKHEEWVNGDAGVTDEEAMKAFNLIFSEEDDEQHEFFSFETLLKVSEAVIGSDKYSESFRACRYVLKLTDIMNVQDKEIRRKKLEDLKKEAGQVKGGWSKYLVVLADWFNFVTELIVENPQVWDIVKEDIWGSWTSWGHYDRDLLVSKMITRLLVSEKIKEIISDSLRKSGKQLSLKNTETVATLLMNYWTHENVMNMVQPHIHVNQYGVKEAATGLANLGGYVAKGAANTVIGGVNMALGVTRGTLFQAKKLAIAVTRELIRNHTNVLAVLGVGAAAYLASSVPHIKAADTGNAVVDQATEDFDTLTHLLQDAATYLVATGSGLAAGYVGMQTFSTPDEQDNEKLNQMTFEQLERERVQYDNRSLMANIIGTVALLIPVGDMAYKGWKIYKKGKRTADGKQNDIPLEEVVLSAKQPLLNNQNDGLASVETTTDPARQSLMNRDAILSNLDSETKSPCANPWSENVKTSEQNSGKRFLRRESWRMLAGFASGLIGGAAFGYAEKIKDKQSKIKKILKSRGLYFTQEEIDLLLTYLNTPWKITEDSEIDKLMEEEIEDDANDEGYISALDSPTKGGDIESQSYIASLTESHVINKRDISSRNKRDILSRNERDVSSREDHSPDIVETWLDPVGTAMNQLPNGINDALGGNPYDSDTTNWNVPYHILHWFRGVKRLLYMNKPHRAYAWEYIKNNYGNSVSRYLDSRSGSNFLNSYIGDIKRLDQLKDTLQSLKIVENHYVPDVVERVVNNITLSNVIDKIYAKGQHKGFIERMSSYHVTALAFYPQSLLDRIDKSGFTEKMQRSYIWLNRMSEENKAAFDKAVADKNQAEQKRILLAEQVKDSEVENKEETLSALEFILSRIRKVLLDLKLEASINNTFNTQETKLLFDEIYPYFIEVLNEYTVVSRASKMTLKPLLNAYEKKQAEEFFKSGAGDVFSNSTDHNLKAYTFLLWDQIKIFGSELKKNINEMINHKDTNIHSRLDFRKAILKIITDFEKNIPNGYIFPDNIARNIFKYIGEILDSNWATEVYIDKATISEMSNKIFRRITLVENVFVPPEYSVMKTTGESDKIIDFLSINMKLSKDKINSQLKKSDVVGDELTEKINDASKNILTRAAAFGWNNAFKNTLNTMLNDIQERDKIPENRRINADTLVMVNYQPEPGLSATIGRILAAPNQAIRDYDKTLRDLTNPENIFEESVLKVISYYRQRNTVLKPKTKGNWALPYTSIIYEHEKIIKEVSDSEDFEVLLTDIIGILESDDEIKKISDNSLTTSFTHLFSYANGNEAQGITFIGNADNESSSRLTSEEKDALVGDSGVEKYLKGSPGSTHIYQVSALYLDADLRKDHQTEDVIPREWGEISRFRNNFYSVPLANVFFIPVDSKFDTSAKDGLLYNSVTKTLARLPLYWKHTNWSSPGSHLFYSKKLQEFLVDAISIKNKKEDWFNNEEARSPVGLKEPTSVQTLAYGQGAERRPTADVPLVPLPAFEFKVIDDESQLQKISHSQSFTKMREDVDASIISVSEESLGYIKNYLDTFITLFTIATLPFAPSFALTWQYSLFLAFDFLVNTISVALAYQLAENKDDESDARNNLIRTYVFWFAGGIGGDAAYEIISFGVKSVFKTLTRNIGRSAKYRAVRKMADSSISKLNGELTEKMTIAKRLDIRNLYNRISKLSGEKELLILQDIKSYKWSRDEINVLSDIEKKFISESGEFTVSAKNLSEEIIKDTKDFLQPKVASKTLPTDLSLKSAQEYISILDSKLTFIEKSDGFLENFYKKFRSYKDGGSTAIDYKYFKNTFGFDSTTTNIIFSRFKSDMIRFKGYSNAPKEIAESVFKDIAVLEVAKSLNVASTAATIIARAATSISTRGTWFTPTEGVLNFYSIYFGGEEDSNDSEIDSDNNTHDVVKGESATETATSNISKVLENYPKYAELSGVPNHYIYPSEENKFLKLRAVHKFDNLLNFDFLNYDKDNDSFSARVIKNSILNDNEISVKDLRQASASSVESDETIHLSNYIRVIFSSGENHLYDETFAFYGASSGNFRDYLIYKIALRVNAASDDFKLGELVNGRIVAESNSNKKHFYFEESISPVSADIFIIKDSEVFGQKPQPLTHADFIPRAEEPTYLDLSNINDFNAENKLIFRASQNIEYYESMTLLELNSINAITGDSYFAIASNKLNIHVDIDREITLRKELELVRSGSSDANSYAGDVALQIARFINENSSDIRVGVLSNGIIRPVDHAKNNIFYQSKYEKRKVRIFIFFNIENTQSI